MTALPTLHYQTIGNITHLWEVTDRPLGCNWKMNSTTITFMAEKLLISNFSSHIDDLS